MVIMVATGNTILSTRLVCFFKISDSFRTVRHCEIAHTGLGDEMLGISKLRNYLLESNHF